jgi:type IV secretory pathway VirB10-like protein
MPRQALRHALLALLCLALAGTAQAQWKWRDAKGNVQYSDLPPPSGTPEKDILQRPVAPARPTIIVAPPGAPASAASAPRPAASAPTKAELDAAARQKKEQEGDATKQKDEERRAAAQRRENCARAQANLRDLQSGTRLTRTNEKGERVFMDEAQIAAETGRARDLITSECR